MARFHSLIVYNLARENLRDVASMTARMHGFGDLVNHMRRAAISVVSTICEGASSGNDRQIARYLTIARASANEHQGQLVIVADLGGVAVPAKDIPLGADLSIANSGSPLISLFLGEDGSQRRSGSGPRRRG